jgi:hypothetical protein
MDQLELFERRQCLVAFVSLLAKDAQFRPRSRGASKNAKRSRFKSSLHELRRVVVIAFRP